MEACQAGLGDARGIGLEIVSGGATEAVNMRAETGMRFPAGAVSLVSGEKFSKKRL